jgi:hypothetical protein
MTAISAPATARQAYNLNFIGLLRLSTRLKKTRNRLQTHVEKKEKFRRFISLLTGVPPMSTQGRKFDIFLRQSLIFLAFSMNALS